MVIQLYHCQKMVAWPSLALLMMWWLLSVTSIKGPSYSMRYRTCVSFSSCSGKLSKWFISVVWHYVRVLETKYLSGINWDLRPVSALVENVTRDSCPAGPAAGVWAGRGELQADQGGPWPAPADGGEVRTLGGEDRRLRQRRHRRRPEAGAEHGGAPPVGCTYKLQSVVFRKAGEAPDVLVYYECFFFVLLVSGGWYPEPSEWWGRKTTDWQQQSQQLQYSQGGGPVHFTLPSQHHQLLHPSEF